MAAKKPKKGQRISADQLLIDFLKSNDLVIIVDEAAIVTNTVKGHVWTVDKRPRVRVQYKDEMGKKEENNEQPSIEMKN